MSHQDKKDEVSRRGSRAVRDFLGAREYRESKIGFLTGASAIRKSFRSGLSSIGATMQIFRLAKNILLPRKRRDFDFARIEDDKIRFDEAVAAYGATEQSIQSMQRGTFWMTWLYFTFVVLSALWGVYLLQANQNISGFLDFIFPFFPLFALIPLFLKQALWHHQLKNRQLTKFSIFVKSPHLWFPMAASATKTAVYFLGFATIWAVMSPYAVFAADPGGVLGPTSDQDLFYRMLQMLAPIGAVSMPIDVSPWVIPLSDAFAAFNTTLLTVGALMLGWHTIAGTVASAYEGEVLGQRWHTIWAPLRVTTGIGSLAPVANGYCAAQILVIQLVVWGGGIANEVWSGYVGYFANEDRMESLILPDTADASVIQSSLADIQNNAAARTMLLSTLEKQVCLLSIREIYTKAYNDYAESTNQPTAQTTCGAGLR